MAITNWYVDPAINGNSGTGTSGDPFGDLQYGANNVTRNSTDGDQFNVIAGTAEVMTATLDLSTYGTPDGAAPLIIRGCTSTANDGGQGVISGGAGNFLLSDTANVHYVDMRLTNTGTASVLRARTTYLIRCKVDTSSNASLISQLGAFYAYNCEFYGRVLSSGGGVFDGNYIEGSQGIAIENSNGTVINNVIKLTGTGGSGIYPYYPGVIVANNVVMGNGTNNQTGILMSNAAGRSQQVVVNNILMNFSGTGSVGIKHSTDYPMLVGNNAFYNCTTNESYVKAPIVDLGGDVALSGDPFVDSANGDYNLAAGSELLGAAWPAAFLGITSTTSDADIGAAQNAAAVGGGGPVIGSRIIRGLGAV